MNTRNAKCPSGLVCDVRGIPGDKFGLLDNNQLRRSGQWGSKLLSICCLGIEDPGPYTLDSDGKINWQDVLEGDRSYLTVQIRIAMYGPDYTFPMQCWVPGCREPFKSGWTVNLETDLPVKTLADEDLAAFRNGNRLEGMLPDGRKFWFRLKTGKDDVTAVKFGTKADAVIPTAVSRIYEVEGTPQGGLRRLFEQDDIPLAFAALREMDKHDCGIETTFSIECPKCGAIKDVEIPFGEGFLIPKK
jgi:hypothetical protein